MSEGLVNRLKELSLIACNDFKKNLSFLDIRMLKKAQYFLLFSYDYYFNELV